MSQTLLAMAKDLVLAQIEAHRLSPEEMHQVLQHTHTSLLALKASPFNMCSDLAKLLPHLRVPLSLAWR